jgi:outer membrane protein assembly factor BamB
MRSDEFALDSMSGSLDMYIARFQAADGAHVWSVAKGGAGNDAPYDVDVNAGSVIVTGYFGGSISFGGNKLTSAGGDDAFVAKLDATNGAHQWSMRFGGTSSEAGRYIATRRTGS